MTVSCGGLPGGDPVTATKGPSSILSSGPGVAVQEAERLAAFAESNGTSFIMPFKKRFELEGEKMMWVERGGQGG